MTQAQKTQAQIEASNEVLEVLKESKALKAQALGLILAGVAEDGYIIHNNGVYINVDGDTAKTASADTAKRYSKEAATKLAAKCFNGFKQVAEAVEVKAALIKEIKFLQEQITLIENL